MLWSRAHQAACGTILMGRQRAAETWLSAGQVLQKRKRAHRGCHDGRRWHQGSGRSLPAAALTRMHAGTASMPGRWQRWTEPLRTWRLAPWGRRSTCLISWMREAWRHLPLVRIQDVACGRLDGPEELHAEALLWRTCGLLCWKAPVCAACVDGRASSGRETQRSRLPKDRFFESECLFYLYMRR